MSKKAKKWINLHYDYLSKRIVYMVYSMKSFKKIHVKLIVEYKDYNT